MSRPMHLPSNSPGLPPSYDRMMTLIAFQVIFKGVKVKVSRLTFLFNLVKKIQTEMFVLGLSNIVHMILVTKRTTPIASQCQG